MPIKGSNKKEYQRKYMQAKRSNIEPGSNSLGLTEPGSNSLGLTASDQLASISSVFSTPVGRQKLNNIFQSFKESSHPEYMKDVRLGVFGPTLDYIYKLSS